MNCSSGPLIVLFSNMLTLKLWENSQSDQKLVTLLASLKVCKASHCVHNKLPEYLLQSIFFAPAYLSDFIWCHSSPLHSLFSSHIKMYVVHWIPWSIMALTSLRSHNCCFLCLETSFSKTLQWLRIWTVKSAVLVEDVALTLSRCMPRENYLDPDTLSLPEKGR